MDLRKPTYGIIVAIVLFYMLGSLIPEVETSGQAMNDSSLCTDAGGTYNTSNTPDCHEAANTSAAVAYTAIPLSGLFNTIPSLIIMAFIVLAVIFAFMTFREKRK